MYRLVALDVDGTLVDSKGVITPTVRQALEETIDNGVEVVIISGRNAEGVSLIINQIGRDLWYVSSGGAMTGRLGTNEIIRQAFIDQATMRTIIELAREAGAGIFVELPRKLYWEGDERYLTWLTSIEGVNICKMEDILQDIHSEPLKMTLVMEREPLLDLEKKINELQLDLHITYSSPVYMEITPAVVNKGVAVQHMASYLNIPMSQVMAVGDGENDIPMIKVAGLGVAMGNAPQVVKDAADLVVPTNDEDGLVKALQLANGKAVQWKG